LRDIIITMLIFGAVPFILVRPSVGILVWSWIGYMSPHRLTWGFAYSLPFAQVIAVATVLGMLFSGEKRRMPWSPTTVVWLLFIAWMCLTTATAIDPEAALPALVRSLKIQFVVLLTLLLMANRERINSLIWVIVLSLGFYGIKGGLFSLLTGGNYKVWGPPETFIYDNNALALALLMTVPLMRYLQTTVENKWMRRAFTAGMALNGLAILTSHSRGALLATTAMTLFLWAKSKYKVRFGLVLFVVVPLIFAFMPAAWFERMETMKTYEQDASAMGRLTAWEFAVDMASARITGGGFNSFVKENYMRFSPEIVEKITATADGRFQDAHSIYFEVIGEHGFIGLILFMSMIIMAFTTTRWIVKNAGNDAESAWIKELGSMLQISLVGYAVGGSFLGLAYYDLVYHLIAIVILLRMLVRDRIGAHAQDGFVGARSMAGRPSGA